MLRELKTLNRDYRIASWFPKSLHCIFAFSVQQSLHEVVYMQYSGNLSKNLVKKKKERKKESNLCYSYIFEEMITQGKINGII